MNLGFRRLVFQLLIFRQTCVLGRPMNIFPSCPRHVFWSLIMIMNSVFQCLKTKFSWSCWTRCCPVPACFACALYSSMLFSSSVISHHQTILSFSPSLHFHLQWAFSSAPQQLTPNKSNGAPVARKVLVRTLRATTHMIPLSTSSTAPCERLRD